MTPISKDYQTIKANIKNLVVVRAGGASYSNPVGIRYAPTAGTITLHFNDTDHFDLVESDLLYSTD